MSEAAGEVKIILAVDAASYSAALDKAKAQLKQLEGSVGSASAKTRAEMREATGSIAVLGEEIGVHLPRHVRTFLAEMPGVASVMANAFSGVAIFAIGAAIVEAGKKVSEFVEKTRDAGVRNAEAWDRSRDSLRLSNLELDASTIHMQNELAKLNHTPENKLAEAIANTAVETEKLDAKLQAAIADSVKLLKEQKPAWYEQTFLGKSGNEYEQRMETEHARHMREAETIQDKLNESISFGNSLLTRRNELEAANKGARTYLDAAGQTQTVDRSRFMLGNVSYKNEIAAVGQLQGTQGVESQHIQKTQGEDKARGELGVAEGKRDAAAAAKLAAEQQIKDWREQLAEVKTLTDISLQNEAVYWQALAAATRSNAPLARAAQQEANKAELAAKTHYEEELLKGWIRASEDQQRAKAEDTRVGEAVQSAWLEGQHAAEELVREQQRAARESFENAAAEIEAAERIGEAAIELQTQRGQLTRLAAAMGLQQLHELSAAQWTSALGDAQNAGAGVPLATIEKHGGIAGRQSETDDAAVRSATTLGALSDSAQELAAKFTDIPAHIRETLDSAVSTINGAILKTLTDPYHRGDWKAAGKSIATGVAGTGLQMAEGSLMKFLPGMGKQGTKGNPMHVVVDGAVPGLGGGMTGAGGAASGITSLLSGGSPPGTSSGGDTGLSNILGAVVPMIPFMAAGGPLSSGMSAIVGEAGPELFTAPNTGRVVSNSDLGFGGTSVTHNISVDARGSGDPAAVEAAVHRSMKGYMQQIPTMAVESVRRYNSQRPTGSRV